MKRNLKTIKYALTYCAALMFCSAFLGQCDDEESPAASSAPAACVAGTASVSQASSSNGLGTTNSDGWFGQSFVATGAGKLYSVTLRMSETNAVVPTGTMTLQLRADCSGAPCADSLGDSEGFDMSTLTSTATDYDFKFTTTPTLTAGTTYWIAAEIPLAGQATATHSIRADTADPYSNGLLKISLDGTSWSAIGGGLYDLYFVVSLCN